VATAVPIYRHSPYRDHLPNIGPYSENFTLKAMKLSTLHILIIMFCHHFKCFIQIITHDFMVRVHKQTWCRTEVTGLVATLCVGTPNKEKNSNLWTLAKPQLSPALKLEHSTMIGHLIWHETDAATSAH
jgi:hypothetical protein